jgi:MFS family permease
VETRVERTPVAGRAWTWYALGMGAWFLSVGLNQVIVAALVTQELRAGGAALATVQTASQLPTLVLILLGGALADSVDRRKLLVGLYLAAGALTALLAWSVGAQRISVTGVAAYGMTLGLVSAFLIPARDSLLSDVTSGDLMRSVSLLTMIQWAMQAVGAFSARLGDRAGLASLIAVQSAVILVGAIAVSRLPRHAPSDSPARRLGLAELAEGVGEVWSSPVLGPVALLAIALGILFIGPFLVVFPLLVRDVYAGELRDLSLLFASFPVGIIASSILIVRLGGIQRKGIAQLTSLAFGALCMAGLGAHPPFWGALAIVFVFGLGAAVFMNASRTLFQERAPKAHRGRVLSVYSVGTMGGGMVGSVLSGVAVSHLGPLATCTTSCLAMLLVIAGFAAFTDLRRLE